jgi:hypothetical protein
MDLGLKEWKYFPFFWLTWGQSVWVNWRRKKLNVILPWSLGEGVKQVWSGSALLLCYTFKHSVRTSLEAHYFSATHIIPLPPRLYSRGWVDPVPDPLLFFLVPGNRTGDFRICNQELWPLDHRGGRWKPCSHKNPNIQCRVASAKKVMRRYANDGVTTIKPIHQATGNACYGEMSRPWRCSLRQEEFAFRQHPAREGVWMILAAISL